MSPERTLSQLTVEQVWAWVVKNPPTVDHHADLDTVLDRVVEDTRTRHVYVVDAHSRLRGVLRLYNVLRWLFPYSALEQFSTEEKVSLTQLPYVQADTAGDAMSPDPVSVQADTTLDRVAQWMTRERVTELPVTDEHGVLVGQISAYEIVHAYTTCCRG